MTLTISSYPIARQILAILGEKVTLVYPGCPVKAGYSWFESPAREDPPATESSTDCDLNVLMQIMLLFPANHQASGMENRRKNGDHTWIAWHNHPIYDSFGEFNGFSPSALMPHGEKGLWGSHRRAHAGIITIGTKNTWRKRVENVCQLTINTLNRLSGITFPDILYQLTLPAVAYRGPREVSADPGMQKGLDRIGKRT